MDFLKLAKARYSVRAYEDRPIEEDKLARVIEAGRVAPTAKNNQPQRIYVVRSDEMREKLKQVCKFTFGAPVVLAVCYVKDRAWQNNLMPGYQSGETDAAIVCTHMMMQATAEGLGSCWVGWFDEAKVRNTLGIPDGEVLTALLPIGYADKDAVPSTRHTLYRDIEDTVVEL